jgi:hypothetical protein
MTTETTPAAEAGGSEVEREQLTVGVSGGPHSGAIYELLTDPTQTHERYFREVQEYLRAGKITTCW